MGFRGYIFEGFGAKVILQIGMKLKIYHANVIFILILRKKSFLHQSWTKFHLRGVAKASWGNFSKNRGTTVMGTSRVTGRGIPRMGDLGTIIFTCKHAHLYTYLCTYLYTYSHTYLYTLHTVKYTAGEAYAPFIIRQLYPSPDSTRWMTSNKFSTLARRNESGDEREGWEERVVDREFRMCGVI